MNSLYFMLLMVAALTHCLRAVSNDNANTNNRDANIQQQKLHRVRRSGVDLRQNCNTWSSWINENHPNSTNQDDREQVSQQDMDTFCPPNIGGNVTKIECKDNKGEPFHGNQTDRRGEWIISCVDPHYGVLCDWAGPTSTSCPDIFMRYYCHCPPLTTTTGAVAANTGSGTSTPRPTTTYQYSTSTHRMSTQDMSTGVSQPSPYNGDQSGAGQLFVSSVIYLIVSVILFQFNS